MLLSELENRNLRRMVKSEMSENIVQGQLTRRLMFRSGWSDTNSIADVDISFSVLLTSCWSGLVAGIGTLDL